VAANDFINIYVYRGDDVSIALNFSDLNKDPIDITNWKISFTVKDKTYKSDLDAAILIDVLIHGDPVNGKTGIFIPHSMTDPLEGVYQYDIQFTTDAGLRRTFARGQIDFLDDVSRR
jgi:hypothetical protein